MRRFDYVVWSTLGALAVALAALIVAVDHGVPAWSPSGDWLALALRDGSSSPSKQLWLMRPDGSEARAITANPKFTHGSYHWDAWGRALVIQRVQLGVAYPKPELVVWSLATGETRVVAVDATLAQWVP